MKGQKSTLAVSKGVSPVYWLANLTHDDKVVGSNLVPSKMLDGNWVKAMPGY